MSKFQKILIVFIILVAFGFVLYLLITGGTSLTPIEQNFTDETLTPSNTPQAAINLFSTSPVTFYWLNSKTNAVYFLSPEGKVYKTFGDGRDEVMSEQTLPHLHSMTASPDGTKIIAHFSYPLNQTFALFDTATNSWERLPENTIAATFDSTSSKISYAKSGSNAGFFILTLSDNKTADVLRLSVLDGALSWNKSDELLFTGRSSNVVPPEIWSIDIKKKTVKQIADRLGLMYQFAPDGNYGLKLIQPTLNDAQLFLTDGGSTTITRLTFTTIPSKCSFSAQTLYCAIPREFPVRAVLPDDYLKEKFFTDDVFVSYGIETGVFTIISQPQNPIDAEQLMVRGEQLLFLNRYDGKLYALPL